jgi:hypothetical protein
MWYCVHAIHYFEYTIPVQSDYLVWEHLYLIKAESREEARDKGEFRARQDESAPGEMSKVNNRSARLRFITIRKVVDCEDLDLDSNYPTDGTELSYSEFIPLNQEEFNKLAHGHAAIVKYLE